ncbi:DCC1-like thiol-disulfide oxidoreductase family protein [Bradyrhizobium sp. HKCCYLS20291]|uniref:DCC1-like thiol-disulfide oxidoreductase family protein n=1 Tax=Bradyrhizobium sp. HKCCYLS20291 TaxID=3420766 RepID=UPI003EC12AB2
MAQEQAPCTVYFDGSCPLCRAEIGYYVRTDEAGALCFIDVSQAGAAVPDGLTQREAMQRFHVRAGDGRLLSALRRSSRSGGGCRAGAGRRGLHRCRAC